MLKIGEFAQLGRVSVKTLRHYSRLGLLAPAWVDRFTGYRYYSIRQLPELNRVLALKDLGFSLEQVRQLLKDDLSASELQAMLHAKRKELTHRLQAERARLERIEARLRHIERNGTLPAHEVTLQSVSPVQVLGIRAVIPAHHRIQDLFHDLERYLHVSAPEIGAAVPRLAIYYDVAPNQDGIDAEAAVPVTSRRIAEAPAIVHELPGAPAVACHAHTGEQESLGEAYRAVLQWIEENGYQVSGPTREWYHRETNAHALQFNGHLPVGASAATTWAGHATVIDVQLPVEKKRVSSYLLRRKEEAVMEPKIVHWTAFTVAGMEYKGKNENNEIKELWGVFWPRATEIKHVVWDRGSFGICRDWPEKPGLDYLAAVEVEKVEDLPEGMTVWQIPEQTYAVFPCTLLTLHEAYRHAFEDWMPRSRYERAKGPDFEHYTAEFIAEEPGSTMYIYVPIEKQN